MIGQRGAAWFLSGTFGGGTATRACSVPGDQALFFPLINAVNINTPNVCGQGSVSISVQDLRAASAAFVDGASNVFAELDGAPVKHLQRLKSDVFAVALPEDNVFDAPCLGPVWVTCRLESSLPLSTIGYTPRLDRSRRGITRCTFTRRIRRKAL